MKRTSLLLVLGLALLLGSAAAPKANAGVVVGAPVYPVRAYGYVEPGYVVRPYYAPYLAFGPRPFYRRGYARREFYGRDYGRDYSRDFGRRFVDRRDRRDWR